MNENRYEVRKQSTICGDMFVVIDTMNGQDLFSTFYFEDEAERVARRLNAQDAVTVSD